MSKCGNCKKSLGCSCKKRTASDGTSCCANCLSSYEIIVKQTKLKIQPSIEHKSSLTNPGVILNVRAE